MSEYTLYILNGKKLLAIYRLDDFKMLGLKVSQEMIMPTLSNATRAVVSKGYKIIAKIDFFK